jgi:hypothetical protein
MGNSESSYGSESSSDNGEDLEEYDISLNNKKPEPFDDE